MLIACLNFGYSNDLCVKKYWPGSWKPHRNYHVCVTQSGSGSLDATLTLDWRLYVDGLLVDASERDT